MIEAWILLAFIPAGLALTLAPGADMLFCLGLGARLARGRVFARALQRVSATVFSALAERLALTERA